MRWRQECADADERPAAAIHTLDSCWLGSIARAQEIEAPRRAEFMSGNGYATLHGPGRHYTEGARRTPGRTAGAYPHGRSRITTPQCERHPSGRKQRSTSSTGGALGSATSVILSRTHQTCASVGLQPLAMLSRISFFRSANSASSMRGRCQADLSAARRWTRCRAH